MEMKDVFKINDDDDDDDDDGGGNNYSCILNYFLS